MAEALRAGRGGIAGLLHLIRLHGDVVEADFRRFHRVDLRDYLRPLRLRQFKLLFKALPSEAESLVALGGHGFSILELLVMENGMSGGSLNPRHPWSDTKRATSAAETLAERQAYYDKQREQQSASATATAPVANEHHGDGENGDPETD